MKKPGTVTSEPARRPLLQDQGGNVNIPRVLADLNPDRKAIRLVLLAVDSERCRAERGLERAGVAFVHDDRRTARPCRESSSGGSATPRADLSAGCGPRVRPGAGGRENISRRFLRLGEALDAKRPPTGGRAARSLRRSPARSAADGDATGSVSLPGFSLLPWGAPWPPRRPNELFENGRLMRFSAAVLHRVSNLCPRPTFSCCLPWSIGW